MASRGGAKKVKATVYPEVAGSSSEEESSSGEDESESSVEEKKATKKPAGKAPVAAKT